MEHISDGEERGFGEVAEREDAPGDEPENQDDEQADDAEPEDQDDPETEPDDQEPDSDDDDQKDEDEDDPENPDPKKTEKGTKLDPNPKSAVHQQLANVRKVAGQMEKVLADPQKLAKFMKAQYGIEVPLDKGTAQDKPEGDQTQENTPTVFGKKFTAKDFESLDDVANVVNQLTADFQKEIKARDQKIQDLSSNSQRRQDLDHIRQVADTLDMGMKTLRTEPELNPKSPEFIEGLEEEISEHYHQLDWDDEKGMYTGKYDLKEIGQRFIKAARKARKVGSKQAQTIVRDKTGGKVRTGTTVQSKKGGEELSPGDSIAAGIASVFGGKK